MRLTQQPGCGSDIPERREKMSLPACPHDAYIGLIFPRDTCKEPKRVPSMASGNAGKVKLPALAALAEYDFCW